MLALLPGLLVKLATRGARRLGLMPQSTYVHEIMQALKRGDLDEAVSVYRLCVSRRQASNITEVARELIEQFVDIRVDKLQSRIDEIENIVRARKSLHARLRRWWARVLGLFGRKPLPEARSESELRAELAEHKAMIEGLLTIKSCLKSAG